MPDQKKNAGNIGDVIKHAILPELAIEFGRSQSEDWSYCETHAGFFDYPLPLLKDRNAWKGGRAWSIGVIEKSGGLNMLGHYGAELGRSFDEGVYPGSIRIVNSASPPRLKQILGWDLFDDQVSSFQSKSQRITVRQLDGYEALASGPEGTRLVFGDPFWTDDGETDKVKRLVDREESVVIWYPVSDKSKKFRDWAFQQPHPYIEIQFRYWTANRNGWAGQDQRGAGLFMKGLPDAAMQKALEIGEVLKKVFEGSKHPGKPRKDKSGSTITPQSRDLSLRITSSF